MLGQKNIDSKLEYLKQTDATHKAASLVINWIVKGQDGQNFSTVYNDLKETKQEPLEAPNPENYNHQSPQTNYQPPQTEYWHPQTQHPQTNYQPQQTSYYPSQTPYPPQAPYYPPPQPYWV